MGGGSTPGAWLHYPMAPEAETGGGSTPWAWIRNPMAPETEMEGGSTPGACLDGWWCFSKLGGS
mgnify:CR=1 FL=1